jgi:autotransporter-associated beta strand protein
VGISAATFNGASYDDVPNSSVRLVDPSDSTQAVDLCMYQLQANPAGLSPLAVSSTAPASGSSIVAIGYGANRAASETYWDSSWNVVSSTVTGGFAGYDWAGGNTKRWGTNNTTQIYGTTLTDNYGITDAWETSFSATGGSSEMQVAGGDSGGAVFYKSGSTWQLAGILLAEGTFSGQPASTAVFNNASYFADLSKYAGEIAQTMAAPQPLYWSGAGVWDHDTTGNWSRVSGGPYSQTWAGGDAVLQGSSSTVTLDAVFEGAPGIVNVASGGVNSVNSITFSTDGYTLAGAGAVTLTGAGGNITTGSSTDTINCSLAGSVGLTKNGAGTLILGATNTYTGGTTINAGTLQIGGGGATGSIAGNVVVNAATATLAFNRADTVTFAGNISGVGGVTQMGPGRVILTGSNTYKGLTTVNAGGALELGVSAEATVLTYGADVQNSSTSVGTLVFDYMGSSAEASLLASIRADLQSGLFKDSLAGTLSNGALVTLGYIDNGSSSITIEPMLAGDANHDGSVDIRDFTLMKSSWLVSSGATWANGDFNADGIVDIRDFTLLQTNWLKTWSPVVPALAGVGIASVTTVPEPSSGLMLVISSVMAGLWTMRRRSCGSVA